jgi:hypothetical protein
MIRKRRRGIGWRKRRRESGSDEYHARRATPQAARRIGGRSRPW